MIPLPHPLLGGCSEKFSPLGMLKLRTRSCGPSCISNCDAKAMCGIDSADGKTPCGLNLCCGFYGWCGIEAAHCVDADPRYGKTPCQQGFGSCEVKKVPTCSKSSGSGRRHIGYYQGWNTRERACDKVWPRQINTRGLTHLYYAFAYFHPTTFQMMPMHEGDVPLYGEFTSLKRNGLQTWIAVGGVSNAGRFICNQRLTGLQTSGLSMLQARHSMPSVIWCQVLRTVQLSFLRSLDSWKRTASRESILTGSIPLSPLAVAAKRTPQTLCSWLKR